MKVIKTGAVAEAPQGAPFIIDHCEFAYDGHIALEYSSRGIDRDRLEDWPMVYILANDEEAYVGQTTSITRRMVQHAANPEKKVFTSINIIFNSEFNASVITDYEHRLIQYMHGDGRYRLTNKNDGMTDSNYFSKSKYAEMFEDLWGDLRQINLAEKSLEQIEESDVFKYSPFKGLNVDQQLALDDIIAAIDSRSSGSRPLVVEGMPGTGKTVLAIYLLKRLKDDVRYKGLNIRLMEPATALRKTLRKALKTVNGLSASDVIAPSDLVKPKYGFRGKEHRGFDIVLVDESHLLKRRVNLGMQYGSFDRVCATLGLPQESSQLDWILSQVMIPVFFYDPLQTIGPSGVTPAELNRELGDSLRNPIRLESQMRVKGGRRYLEYIKDVLSGRRPKPERFIDYELVFHEDICGFTRSFEKDLGRASLTRMLAGFAWPWLTKPGRKPKAGESPATYDMDIDGVRLRWNRVQENWVGLGMEVPDAAQEVGCIHSIQGYDLSYAYVIIGRDIKLGPDGRSLIADRLNYFDKNGKNTANQEELDAFIRNVYYVLLTRGICGTHIFVVDSVLRRYLSRFFATGVA